MLSCNIIYFWIKLISLRANIFSSLAITCTNCSEKKKRAALHKFVCPKYLRSWQTNDCSTDSLEKGMGRSVSILERNKMDQMSGKGGWRGNTWGNPDQIQFYWKLVLTLLHLGNNFYLHQGSTQPLRILEPLTISCV